MIYLIWNIISDIFCVFPQVFRRNGLPWRYFPPPHLWICPANGRHFYCEADRRMNLFLPICQNRHISFVSLSFITMKISCCKSMAFVFHGCIQHIGIFLLLNHHVMVNL